MDWSIDKDSALLKRLQCNGISLSDSHQLEFNVDFNFWPPSSEALSFLKTQYGNLKLFEPGSLDELQEGYVSLRIKSNLSYNFVTNMQREISDAMNPFGGYCNSWAVLLHDAAV